MPNAREKKGSSDSSSPAAPAATAGPSGSNSNHSSSSSSTSSTTSSTPAATSGAAAASAAASAVVGGGSGGGGGHLKLSGRRGTGSSSGSGSGSGGPDSREMVGGCCVCSDERGWDENPLVYCDGPGCSVAVHQACYGIVSVPTGPWFCRKCESQERSARVRCELCPSKEGALKRTDSNSWAHVVCALYIPEVRFGNVSTMEPIVLGLVPQDRYLKVCYLCESQGRESRAATGACMQCNRSGCKQSFHVTCAQSAGLLCEEAGNYMDNVKYCGYCEYHYQRINKKIVKTIPAFKAVKARSTSPEASPEKAHHGAGSATTSAGASKHSATISTAAASSSSGQHLSSTGRESSNSSSNSSRDTQSVKKGSSSGSSSNSKKSRGSSKSGVGMSSEVKIEAPKFVLHDTNSKNSESSPHSSSSSSSSPSTSFSANGATGSEERTTITKLLDDDTRSSGKAENGEKTASQTTAGNLEKPPVVLKFGKDNGTYYKKDPNPSPPVSSSASSSTCGFRSSGSKKEHHRDKSHSRKEKRSRPEDSKVEADTTSNDSKQSDKEMTASTTLLLVPPPTGSLGDNAVSSASSSVAPATSNGGSSSPSKSIVDNSASSDKSEMDPNAVKVESMEVDPPLPPPPPPPLRDSSDKISDADLALSAIKTTCSVTLDKSKVDLKLMRRGDFATTPRGAESEVRLGGVQLTALPPSKDLDSPVSVTRERIEVDTSSRGVTITSEKVQVHNDGASGMVMASLPSTSGSGVTIEQVSPSKEEYVISPNTGKLPRISASGKRIGRPPKKGTHVATSSMSQIQAGLASPPGEGDGGVKRKRKSPNKRPLNGSAVDNAAWMMGATLNPNSSMAKEMNMALEDEIKAHSAYDAANDKHYLGVPFLGRRRRSPSAAPVPVANEGAKSQPQTLEELLERQWEQGSQFLMEQASHFDIASLLSSLHQLKEENVDLEDSVDRLVQRRDHLLAVRARLLALSSLSLSNSPPAPERAVAPPPHPQMMNGPSSSGSGRSSAHVSPRNSAAIVSPMQRVSVSSRPPEMTSPRGSVMIHQHQGPPPPPPHGPPQQQQHGMHPMASPRDQRTQQQQQMQVQRDQRMSPRGHPMENGLDYHHHQQQQQQQQQQQHMAAAAHHHAAASQRREMVNDRIMPAHLLAVVSSSATPSTSSRGMIVGPSSHPPPPPRQSSYPPLPPQQLPPGTVSGGPPHPSAGMAPPSQSRAGMSSHPMQHSSQQQHQMMRGGPLPPLPGMPPGSQHHYGGGPPPGHGYQMVSPPPSHSSMVTLDRSSQQHLRNPPTSQHPMRIDKR